MYQRIVFNVKHSEYGLLRLECQRRATCNVLAIIKDETASVLHNFNGNAIKTDAHVAFPSLIKSIFAQWVEHLREVSETRGWQHLVAFM